jgi:hypothetical protein
MAQPTVYFDASHLPQPSSEYVAWLDVMGTQASMSRSLNATANFIFKLHAAALQASRSNVQLYPVMDGFYAASADQSSMLDFLREVLTGLAEEFNRQTRAEHQFVVRGGLAFGPVVHGQSVPQNASPILASSPNYRDSILLGMAMVQAHQCEATAPPFGVAVHESARTFAPSGQAVLHSSWWRWRNGSNAAIWKKLQTKLPTHLDWCADRALPLGYPADRIAAHKEMVRQYFLL